MNRVTVTCPNEMQMHIECNIVDHCLLICNATVVLDPYPMAHVAGTVTAFTFFLALCVNVDMLLYASCAHLQN